MTSRAFREQAATRVFYESRRGARVHVTVTDTHFRAYNESYRVASLTRLEWGLGATQVNRRLTVRLVAAEVPIVIGIMAVGPSWVAAASAIGYLGFAAGTIWFGVRRWPTPYALIADYDEQPVVLFTSTDHTEFHQVCRALQRAYELHQHRVVL